MQAPEGGFDGDFTKLRDAPAGILTDRQSLPNRISLPGKAMFRYRRMMKRRSERAKKNPLRSRTTGADQQFGVVWMPAPSGK
jgi:hypothetical protein